MTAAWAWGARETLKVGKVQSGRQGRIGRSRSVAARPTLAFTTILTEGEAVHRPAVGPTRGLPTLNKRKRVALAKHRAKKRKDKAKARGAR